MELKERIRVLTEASGPAGFEDEAAGLAESMLKPLVDSVYRDTLGNVIGYKSSGKSGAKKLLIETHIDEIGFIITGSEQGFLKFSTLGGVDTRLLPASEIKILTDEHIWGVIDAMPPHVLEREEMSKSIDIAELCIDTGGREVPAGTPAVFAGKFVELNDGVLSSKAMDNRSCFAIALDVLERIDNEKMDMDVYVMASVQEELGCRGATTGAFVIEPDQAIIMDVTHAHIPGTKKEKTLEFGGGAAIGRGPNMSRPLGDYLIQLAEDKDIKYQIEVMPGSSGTTAGSIQISREGVPTAIISLPIKYMHSPVETMLLEDALAISDLLMNYLKSPFKGVCTNA